MSLDPGVQQYNNLLSARGIGGMQSIHQDMPTPLEYGTAVDTDYAKYVLVASTGNDIPGDGSVPT